MSETHLLHWTLGPVQGFVKAARRTRDLWAGSLLLSMMAGTAIKTLQKIDNAKVLFPSVENDPLLAALSGDFKDHTPAIGTLPNRFKAEVPADFDPNILKGAVQEKWRELAKAVWCRYVAEAAERHGPYTRAIWERQVESLWDIAWVKGPKPMEEDADARWLDLRKNWRTHRPSIEGGDHCPQMSGLQEISGQLRTLAMDEKRAFWSHVRHQVKTLDLDVGEALSAPALIKRLLLPVFKDVFGWTPQWHGTHKPVQWRSTHAMASLPWVRAVAEACPDASSAYTTTVQSVLKAEGATEADHLPDGTKLGGLETLSGALVHPVGMEAFLRDLDEAPDPAEIEALRRAFKGLQNAAEVAGLPRGPSSYYAVVMMDGDRIGQLLRSAGPDLVTKALTTFSQEVPTVVHGFSGAATIYAGGDDVLALALAPDALRLADTLRRRYREAFREAAEGARAPEEATLSGAVVFAHHRAPLGNVLDEARYQLDEMAKNKTGRNALAVAVHAAGTVKRSWAGKWETVDNQSIVDRLMTLAKALGTHTSSSFLYAMADRFAPVLDEMKDSKQNPKKSEAILEPLKVLLAADLARARERDGNDAAADAPQAINTLLALGTPDDPLAGAKLARTLEEEGILMSGLAEQEQAHG